MTDGVLLSQIQTRACVIKIFGLQNMLNTVNVVKCVLTQINIAAQQENQIKPRNKLEWY